jgi:hypothetical protein
LSENDAQEVAESFNADEVKAVSYWLGWGRYSTTEDIARNLRAAV